MLFNEPKLLKLHFTDRRVLVERRFSALQRAEIAEIASARRSSARAAWVSVLFNEPKLLKYDAVTVDEQTPVPVSVLFNEPKLLKCTNTVSPFVEIAAFQCSSTSRNC